MYDALRGCCNIKEARLNFALYHDGTDESTVKSYELAVQMMAALPPRLEILKLDFVLGNGDATGHWYIQQINWPKLLGHCKELSMLRAVRICVMLYDHDHTLGHNYKPDSGGLYLYKVCQRELNWLRHQFGK